MRSAVSFVLALVCVAFAIAGDSPATSAASSSVAYTPQEQFLAKSTYGNFACRVNSLKVTTDNPGMGEPRITADHIRSAFENVATLEWAHVAQSSFSSFDGRNDEKILGTPGGDMGEFIQAIAALAKVTGKKLSQEEVSRIFNRYIKVMTRPKFFYETDEKAYTRLAVATGCRNLHVAEMGGMKRKREAFLEKVAMPEHIGDPFIRFLANNATSLDLNADYIQASLAAYHNVLWTTPSKPSTKLCYLETKGPSNEAAIVNIKSDSFCTDQGLAPMVSPQLACPAPVFVNHPEAVRILRRELVAVMAEETKGVDPRDVMAAYNLIAETNLEKFLSQVATDLPVYTVTFTNSSPLMSASDE